MLSDHSTIDVIKRSRRRITILFSDIEESTRHWERRGDIDARMLIDRHNRLLFPVIRKFRGRIIKTLGDAIMAAFDKTDDAVKAAIAIQQILARERERDQYFSLRTRIGIHTGTGLVEEDDIFGDVVNVAAKVQAEADGNQILLTSSAAAHLEKNHGTLTEHSCIKPKGKRKAINVVECPWRDHKSLIGNIQPDALLPLMKRQRFELLTYLAVGLCALFFIYYRYLRYWLTDRGFDLNFILDTPQLPSDTLPFLMSMALALFMFVIYLLRIHFISRAMLRALNGLFGFGL
ncbi:MAG: Adenylate cyclase, partial [Pseudomonadota bacterium]|nr:Adenylate cyclase [Pseudomonadota bacterium]